MKELMQGPDVEASENIEVEDIGGLGKSKGTMDFPRSAAGVAKKIMGQRMFKGLPKQWKGGGDYFFETQDDGTIKVTGGDKANSLTGGKSTIVKDKERIRKIIETARGGDILEENVSYDMQGKEQMLQADAQRRANVAGPEAAKQMEEYKEKVSLGESELTEDEGSRTGEIDLTPDVRESSAPADSPVAARLKEARSGLMGMIENAENEQLAQAYRAALEQVEKGLRAELGE